MILLDNYKEFGNILSNRFHTILSHLENVSGNFTPFIQAINRSSLAKLQSKTLTYIGLDEQRNRLLLNKPATLSSNNEAEDVAWRFLSETDFREKTIESYTFYDNFRKGKLRIQDISIQSLKGYFEVFSNEPQKAEYEILSKYFDITSAYFITLPLIQFGDFDGLVYVVFDEKDVNLYKLEEVIIRVIKNLSIEYEKLLLEWSGAISESSYTDLNSHLSFLQSDEYYELINTNPILGSLRFKQYYLNSNEYYRSSIARLHNYYKKGADSNGNVKENAKQISTIWEIPEALRTAFHQFLIYFTEYTEKIHNVKIDIRVERIDTGLILIADDNDQISLLDNLLSQYLDAFLMKNYSNIEKKIIEDEVLQFQYNQSIRELKRENEFLKSKIQDHLEMLSLLRSITDKKVEEIKMEIRLFKDPQINLLEFTQAGIHQKSMINITEIKAKLFEAVRNSIKKGDVLQSFEALERLYNSTEDASKNNTLLMLKFRYGDIESQKTIGVISDSKYKIEKNKIIKSIIDLIE